MLNRHVDTLLPIVVITLMSFAVAYGLFKVLESTAAVGGSWYQLGGGAAGFAFVFWMLRSWYDDRDKRGMREDNLAIAIASLSAIDIVRGSRESEDSIAALNTGYSDAKETLRDLFSGQDKDWLEKLLNELRTQTRRQARQQYPHLREWQPEEEVIDTVVEDF
jgi:hypothetical protein